MSFSDTQSPALKECPDQPVAVQRYAFANSLLPNGVPRAKDNVYVSKYRVTNSIGGAIWPSDDLVLSKMTVFHINVADHAGNTDSCTIVAAIIGKKGECSRPSWS